MSEILISNANLLENVMTNNSNRPLLNQKCFLLLRDLLTTFQYHWSNLWLWKRQVQEKSPYQFLYTLEVKPKTSIRRFFANESKHKAIRADSMLWSSIPKQRSHTKINQQVKKTIYNWILQHPQVVVYPIEYYCLKLSINGQVEPQLVPKLLFQLSVWEIHNSMVSTKKECGIKEARDS